MPTKKRWLDARATSPADKTTMFVAERVAPLSEIIADALTCFLAYRGASPQIPHLDPLGATLSAV